MTAEQLKTVTQAYAMWLSLCAFLYPVVMKVYDGIFVSLVINCCRKRFSLSAAVATLIALLATIPILVLKLCSDSDASEEELMASATFAKSGAKLRAAFNDLKACCFCLSAEERGSWRSSRRKVRPDTDEANLYVGQNPSRRTTGGNKRNLKESADDDGDGGEGGEGGGGGMADDDFADFGGADD